MKTPTWAIIVGIFLMLFGGCDITQSVQAINMPNLLEVQKEMMNDFTNSIDTNTNSLDSLNISNDSINIQTMNMFKNVSNSMQSMFEMTEFTKKWTVRFGYIGIFVAFIYILSGVFLMIKRDFSIKLVYFALFLSILFSITQSIVLSLDSANGSLFALSSGLSNVFSIIIDIILMIIVTTIDKSDYNFAEEIE